MAIRTPWTSLAVAALVAAMMPTTAIAQGTRGILLPVDTVRPAHHLFDFSGSHSTVHVDPLLDLAWGPTLPAPQSAWRNVRGAQFKATWDDGRWTASGSLEEHQSLLVGPMAWYSAANGAMPGWGRAKLGRDGDLRTADSLYVDVARALGRITWYARPETRDGLRISMGIEPWQWGRATETSTLGSVAHMAPAPMMAAVWQNPKHTATTTLRATKWVLDERGPLGATSESLFEWTNTWMLGHCRKPSPHWEWEGVIGRTALANAQRLIDEGTSFLLSSWWSGVRLHVQRGDWFAEAQWASEWGRQAASVDGDEPSFAASNRWQVHLEHKTPRSLIRMLFTARSGATHPFWAAEPTRNSLLSHAGLPLGPLWTRRLAVSGSHFWPKPRIRATCTLAHIDLGTQARAEIAMRPLPRWPIQVWLGGEMGEAAIPDRIMVGMRWLKTMKNMPLHF